jgi:hypothetical protein
MNVPINERVTVSSVCNRPKNVPDPVLVPTNIRDLLNVRRLQGRLNTRQTAALLNCAEHDIAVLVAKGLLTPLGHPVAGSMKYFAPTEVLELAGDREKMGQICDVLYEHWREKNAAKASATRKARSATSGGSNGARKQNGH